jgi:hypothetical protein
MADAFGKDNQTTTSRDVAVLALYLGYPLARIESHPDRTETFTVVCPQFDFEQVVKEAASDETNVSYASLQKANSIMGGRIGFARKIGVWTVYSKIPRSRA